MSEAFKNGYLLFDKSWILENEFFKSLTHAEFRIMTYLIASVLRLTKRDQRYKRGLQAATLYQDNNLLVANVSTRTIAEKCRVSRSTVCKALDKFHEVGAAIRIPSSANESDNNLYVLGTHDPGKEKEDLFFVDSRPIKSGAKMPQDVRDHIESHYKDRPFRYAKRFWKGLFDE